MLRFRLSSLFNIIIGLWTGAFVVGLVTQAWYLPHHESRSVQDTSWQSSNGIIVASREEPKLLQQRNTASPEHAVNPNNLKLPTPIFVMGLMKVGTTSIESYFRCGFGKEFQSRVSHYDCSSGPNNNVMSCGRRMRKNLKLHKPLFDGLESFHVYAELDAQENNGGMTLPQVSFLQEIHETYPNATWILNLRDSVKWIDSVNRWEDLRQRFIDNNYPGLPKGVGGRDEDMIDFYYQHAQNIRDFVQEHASHALVEVAIDDENAGQVMENAFGISKSCWGKRNVNTKTNAL